MYVLMGQRRTWAAVVAGRHLIPVMIIDSPEEASAS
ncbi:ParB-like chromosome segregation protein Spo0J [Arthrobacter sp. BE255]|nr:ParB-like chromosome segregation protein Spo0J [Arthrobacter sp. BE255]